MIIFTDAPKKGSHTSRLIDICSYRRHTTARRDADVPIRGKRDASQQKSFVFGETTVNKVLRSGFVYGCSVAVMCIDGVGC